MAEPLTVAQVDEVTRLYFGIFNDHDKDRFSEILAEDYVNHSRMGTIEGLAPFSGLIAGFYAALPDVRWRLLDQRSDGDRIIYHYEVSGTHQGELMGVQGTGAEVRFTGMEMNRIAGGKIAETWNYVDMVSLMSQIGAIPVAE